MKSQNTLKQMKIQSVIPKLIGYGKAILKWMFML